MGRFDEVLSVLRATQRPLWTGEVCELLGLPFHQLESIRPVLQRLVRSNLARELRGPSGPRVYYEAVESKHG